MIFQNRIQRQRADVLPPLGGELRVPVAGLPDQLEGIQQLRHEQRALAAQADVLRAVAEVLPGNRHFRVGVVALVEVVRERAVVRQPGVLQLHAPHAPLLFLPDRQRRVDGVAAVAERLAQEGRYRPVAGERLDQDRVQRHRQRQLRTDRHELPAESQRHARLGLLAGLVAKHLRQIELVPRPLDLETAERVVRALGRIVPALPVFPTQPPTNVQLVLATVTEARPASQIVLSERPDPPPGSVVVRKQRVAEPTAAVEPQLARSRDCSSRRVRSWFS